MENQKVLFDQLINCEGEPEINATGTGNIMWSFNSQARTYGSNPNDYHRVHRMSDENGNENIEP